MGEPLGRGDQERPSQCRLDPGGPTTQTSVERLPHTARSTGRRTTVEGRPASPVPVHDGADAAHRPHVVRRAAPDAEQDVARGARERRPLVPVPVLGRAARTHRPHVIRRAAPDRPEILGRTARRRGPLAPLQVLDPAALSDRPHVVRRAAPNPREAHRHVRRAGDPCGPGAAVAVEDRSTVAHDPHVRGPASPHAVVGVTVPVARAPAVQTAVRRCAVRISGRSIAHRPIDEWLAWMSERGRIAFVAGGRERR